MQPKVLIANKTASLQNSRGVEKDQEQHRRKFQVTEN